MKRIAFVAAMSVVLAMTSIAAEPKQPWDYTDAERLEKRFDPDSIRMRWLRHAKESGSVQSDAVSDVMDNVIVGRDNPELLMPFELFQNLIARGVIRRGQDDWRERFNAQLQRITDPGKFWTAVESSSQSYIVILQREDAVIKQIRPDWRPAEAAVLQSEIAQREQCAARAAALDAATRVLGRSVLHRALYEIIAPTMATFSPPEQGSAQVAFVAAGCR